MQAGAILGPIDRSSAQKPVPGGPITPVHDLNVPYEGTEEYETPTAEILFPPVSFSLMWSLSFSLLLYAVIRLHIYILMLGFTCGFLTHVVSIIVIVVI